MKKLFTIIACTLMTLSANAFNVFYAVYAQAYAYPVGAGKIYLSPTTTGPTEDSQWQDEMEFQAVISTSSNYYAFNKPADGYKFAGWSRAEFAEDGSPIFNTDIVEQGPLIHFTSEQMSESSEEEAWGMMPMDPNDVLYGLFTHVTTSVKENHEYLGKAVLDKVCNEIGEEITLTGEPDLEYDPTAKFAYWVKESTGEKIYDNPLKVKVTGLDNYEAHFTGDMGVELNFPENGGYIVWYNDREIYSLPENIWNPAFNLIDSLDNDYERVCNIEVKMQSHYMWDAKTPCIFYGSGSGLVALKKGTEESEPNANSFMQRLTEDTNVDDLQTGYYYFTVDIKGQKFDRIPAGTVLAAGSDYVRYASSDFLEGEEAPEVLYWNDEADGIKNISTDAANNDGRIYNLNGMQMTKVGKGIYILNGKKYINK